MDHRLLYSAALFACILLWASSVTALEPLRLKLAHNAGAGTPRDHATAKLAGFVAERSSGRVVIDLNPGGAIRENLDVLLDLRTGRLDMSIYPHGTLASAVPEVDALGLPYAFTSSQQVWQILDGPLGHELGAKIEAHGMILLAWMTNGGRHITNGKRPIHKPEDMRGLRIRTTADKPIMDMMAALGAQVVPVGYDHLNNAMKIGYVDGQENSLSVIQRQKLDGNQKYIAITNHRYSFSPVLVSRAAWDKLSSEDQKMLRVAVQEAAVLQRRLYDEDENRILEAYRKTPSVVVTTPAPEPFRASVQKVWDSWQLKPFGAFVRKLRAASLH